MTYFTYKILFKNWLNLHNIADIIVHKKCAVAHILYTTSLFKIIAWRKGYKQRKSCKKKIEKKRECLYIGVRQNGGSRVC